MPTPDESKILKIIEAEGGECTVGRIAAKMRLAPSYARIILRSMGESDIIDIFEQAKSGLPATVGRHWGRNLKGAQTA